MDLKFNKQEIIIIKYKVGHSMTRDYVSKNQKLPPYFSRFP